MSLRVLLADDHLLVREALRLLLERERFTVVGVAADGREAVRLSREREPDVAVLDLAMPNLNGLDAAREILNRSPRTSPVLLTMHAEGPYVVEALRAGIRGYVLKSQASADLVQAIEQVSRGAIYVSPGVASALVEACAGVNGAPADPLTLREREVLQLIAEGKAAKEIAYMLGISTKTVESHRARIGQKLQIRDTAKLVCYAIRRGLISP